MSGFGFLSLIGWGLIAVLLLYVLYVGQQRSRGGGQRFSVGLVGALLIAGITLNALSAGLVSIPPNQRGLVLNLFTGVRLPSLEPGVHLIAPVIESVKYYDIGQKTYTMSKTPAEGEVIGDDSVTARTSDGQEVFIDASVTYRIDPSKPFELITRFPGDDWTNVLIRPQARSIVYNRAAVYRVEEVYSTKRAELQKSIEDELRQKLADNGLILESFLLRNVTFNPEYAKSVEEKQVAQQNAERAKFLVESERQEAERVRVQAQGRADAAVTAAKGDAEARVISAKAEAESLSLIAAQLKDNPNLLAFRYIEKLAPGVQTIFLPANQPFLLDPKSFVGPTSPGAGSTTTTP
jgi:regulator of protease activity HflC (stomatin/prohibitin superfamily)